MPTDTRKIKQRLLSDFTEEQADTLLDAFFDEEDPVVTQSVLQHEMRRFTIRILLGNGAITAGLLALFAFAS